MVGGGDPLGPSATTDSGQASRLHGDGDPHLHLEISEEGVILESRPGLNHSLPAAVADVIPYITQESIVTAFRGLFPSSVFSRFPFPFVEDLVNSLSHSFPTGLGSEAIAGTDLNLGPALADQHCRLMQRTAEGQQAGALTGKAVLPPLLPFGLSPDEHFRQSLARASHPIPTEQPPVLDWDLQFTAEQTVAFQGSLRELWRECLGPLRELKRRWARAGVHLKTQQTPEGHRPEGFGLGGVVRHSPLLAGYKRPVVRHASSGHVPPLRSVPTAALSRHPP